jgi:hypothetical protein
MAIEIAHLASLLPDLKKPPYRRSDCYNPQDEDRQKSDNPESTNVGNYLSVS